VISFGIVATDMVGVMVAAGYSARTRTGTRLRCRGRGRGGGRGGQLARQAAAAVAITIAIKGLTRFALGVLALCRRIGLPVHIHIHTHTCMAWTHTLTKRPCNAQNNTLSSPEFVILTGFVYAEAENARRV
jgi:hypothetical protein